MKIIPLSEGSYTISHDKVFVPFDEKTDILTERATGSLLVEVQPFLVVIGNDVVLLDAGLGLKTVSGKPIIYDALSKVGYNPADITKVLLSHLHKDHAGGCVFRNAQGEFQLAFPDTPHYIYQPEAAFALQKGKPSFDTDEISYLLEHAKIEWLSAESGAITPDISYEKSGGHSPHHIVFLLQEDNDKAFYGGDEAPQLKQMKVRYMAKYDYDGKKAMQLRDDYAERGKKEGWKFLFFHDIKHAVAQL